MNIHIIINEKFTQKFVEFISKYYPLKSNIFYIYGDKNCFVRKESQYVKFINLNIGDVDFSLADKPNDKIFIHSFYDKKLLRFLFFNKQNIDFSKVVFIAWGADIYNDRYFLSKPVTNFKYCCSRLLNRIYKHIKQSLMKKVKLYMTFACSDIDVINKYYGVNGIQFDCLYPSTVDILALAKLKTAVLDKDQNIKRILLGNSASKTNQHIQALKILNRYSKENIEIVCPLSYGNKDYAEEVIEFGKKLFNKKFKPIIDFMPPQDYANFLNSVDIAIFNNNRQEATGNIEILGYLGKKIYIRSDVTTWNHYVIRDNCSFFDTLKIKDMSFEEFTLNNSTNQLNNQNYFSKIWNDNYVKSLWDKIMNFRSN